MAQRIAAFAAMPLSLFGVKSEAVGKPAAPVLPPPPKRWVVPYPNMDHGWFFAKSVAERIGQMTGTHSVFLRGDKWQMQFYAIGKPSASTLQWIEATIADLVQEAKEYEGRSWYWERPIGATAPLVPVVDGKMLPRSRDLSLPGTLAAFRAFEKHEGDLAEFDIPLPDNPAEHVVEDLTAEWDEAFRLVKGDFHK